MAVTPPEPPSPPTPPEPPALGDTDPPETQITKGPRKKSKKRKATFEFSSDESGSTFQCSVDGEGFAPCTSPFEDKVKRRRHTFEVRATDPAGNVDPTPATWAWKVKRKRR